MLKVYEAYLDRHLRRGGDSLVMANNAASCFMGVVLNLIVNSRGGRVILQSQPASGQFTSSSIIGRHFFSAPATRLLAVKAQ
jgi:hypothetical protein